MQLIVTGWQRHGKDTCCEFIEQLYGLSFAASSWMACQLFLYNDIKTQFGYKTIEECFDDRMNHRKLWHDKIFAFNTPHYDRLANEIFYRHPVYCGIRNKIELDAIRKTRDVLVLWVDASQRKEPEGIESMSVTPDDADIIVDNNGGLEDFLANIKKVMSTIDLSSIQKDEQLKLSA